MAIPWGDSVLKQANDAVPFSGNSHIPELTRGPRTPSLDAMSEEQRKQRMGEDEQISEVHNLPEKVRKPLVASPADSAIEDKRFTEDLHSRKSDGTFIESSGNSKKKYVHKG